MGLINVIGTQMNFIKETEANAIIQKVNIYPWDLLMKIALIMIKYYHFINYYQQKKQ